MDKLLPDSIACFIVKLDLIFVNISTGRGIYKFNSHEIDGQVEIVDGSFQSRLNDSFILQ